MGAFNGSGLFVRSYNWVNDAANGIDITASRVDTEDDGFAAALSNCITRDGQGKATASQLPSVTASYDLGSSSFKWQNAYFSGKVQCGSILASSGAAYKSGVTSRTNTTTLTPDPDLVISVTDTGTYILEALIGVSGTTTSTQGIKYDLYSGGNQFAATSPGFRYTWGNFLGTVTGSATNNGMGFLGPGVTGISLSDIGAVGALGQLIYINGSFIATALDAAVLGFAWSQVSSSANATNVIAGSYIRIQQIA